MYRNRLKKKALLLGGMILCLLAVILMRRPKGTEEEGPQEGEELVIPKEEQAERETWELPGLNETIRVLILAENGTIYHESKELTKEYPGELEYYETDDGFVIVNEVPLEEYLGRVVPSEMPSGYAEEALKAQAVCARTYAVWHMRDYAYPEYQAHVDDSTAYQVYNNIENQPLTDAAVEATRGEIMVYGEEPVKAYYFATSCGSTTDENIWEKGDRNKTPYIKSRLVTTEGRDRDLADEDEFREYILQKHGEDVEISEPWYRWQAYIPLSQIEKNIEDWIKIRAEKSEDGILIQNGEEWEKPQTDTIGEIQSAEIIRRNTGGAVHELLLTGTDGTLKIKYEYNIRLLLSIPGGAIHKNDGTVSTGTILLPSGYFILEPVEEDGNLTGYQVYGGGLGHGAGMSQNGARILAEGGASYEEILKYFYNEITLVKLKEKGYDSAESEEKE